ncbi:lipoprotein [Pontibacter flavimaris]|nr:lipoprotein [Pontibacter flavimaris]
MKQLYFILVAAVILAGCQQQEVVKSHGINEVHFSSTG